MHERQVTGMGMNDWISVDVPGFLNERPTQKIDFFLHCGENQMQGVVIEEPIVYIAEHHIVRFAEFQPAVPRRRYAAVRNRMSYHPVWIILKQRRMFFFDSALFAVIHNNDLYVVKQYPTLRGDSIKQVLADFPRLLVVRYDDVKFQ